MNLAVLVYGSPASSRAHISALGFVRAALEGGHRITRVFFYHDAVTIGSNLIVTPQDETDVGGAWVDVAREHGVELCLCIAAALRRGVINGEEAQRYERGAANLREPFEIVGLGQLAAAIIESDRVVTFP